MRVIAYAWLRRLYFSGGTTNTSWSSAGDSFDFEKICKSVGVTAGWEKELFFFPDVNKDPHNILDEDELQGEIQ